MSEGFSRDAAQVSTSQDHPMPDAANDSHGDTTAPPEPVLELGERRILIVSNSVPTLFQLGRSYDRLPDAPYSAVGLWCALFGYRLLTPNEPTRTLV